LGDGAGGEIGAASTLCLPLVKDHPDHPALLHLAAVVLQRRGLAPQAVPLMERLVRLRPRSPGHLRELALLLRATGRPGRAVSCYRELIRMESDPHLMMVELATLFSDLGRHDAAFRLARRATMLQPDRPAGLAALARAALNRTTLAGDAEDDADRLAVSAGRWWVRLTPLRAECWTALGRALVAAEALEPATPALVRAILLAPARNTPYRLLGYRQLERPDPGTAETLFRRATLASPDEPTNWSGLGEARFAAGDAAGAIPPADRAAELAPESASIQFRRGIFRLAAGDIAGGWPDYLAIYRKAGAIRRLNAPPPWQGEPLTDAHLLIGAEQGVGDEILFAARIGQGVEAARHVSIECDPRLRGLFRRSFPAATVAPYRRRREAGQPVHDYAWLPTADPPTAFVEAGRWLAAQHQSVAAADALAAPWLRPDPDRVARMRDWLSGLGPGLKVGLSWRSRTVTAFRQPHYPGLAALLPLCQVPGVRMISLQYGEGWQQEVALAGAPLHVAPGLDPTDDLDGVAALIAALDLVICPSSTVGWIGAGVGVATWKLYNGPTAFNMGTDHFPGFPTIRGFAKTQAEPWAPLVTEVRNALVQRARISGDGSRDR